MKKILILGGGFAGIETFRQLHRHLHPVAKHDVRIELINRSNYFTFSPMLHEAATGSVSREHVVQPLREILSCCGKDFHQATVRTIDLENKVVKTDQSDHTYDVLVIALGVDQGFFGVPGAAEHALALKHLSGALAIRNRIINSFESASEMHDRQDIEALKKFLRFVIVGGGATGTELAGQISDLVRNEMRDFYGDVPQNMCQIVLVHAGKRVLEQLSDTASKSAVERLKRLGVQVMLEEQVDEVTENGVHLASGSEIASNSVFWTAGTESVLKKMLPESALTERGLANVRPTFQLLDQNDVFAVGDCASVADENFSYPPTAQAAVQAARLTADNIVARLQDRDTSMRKYRHQGDIIPIGNWFGIFELNSMLFRGMLAWLLRRVVFLKTMYGWTNKVQVAFAWILSLFLPRDTSEFE